MTSLSGSELQRRRWRRALRDLAVDSVDRGDFALGGLARRLQHPSVQLHVLPPDPERDLIHFSNEVWEWLDANKTVTVDTRPIELGSQKNPTANAAALATGYKRDEWINYLAVYRSGAIELGLGDRGGWEHGKSGMSMRVFNLISIVGHIWALLKFSGVLNEKFGLSGPWQLTVALRATEGALLGNLGEGWAEPGSLNNSVSGCREPHLLWHYEILEWPNDGIQKDLALKMGDRLENAWGVAQRRHISHSGDRAGQFDVTRIRLN